MSAGIVAESDLTGNLKSEYVFFDGERVARKDFPGNVVSFYDSDHLKTASVITDSIGNIKEDEDYYPWGGELQFVNNDSNHYKFTGKERDAETGLDYFGARYYGNWLGRWMSPDWSAVPVPVPYADLADPQSMNLYGYVRNIPTSRYDADGHLQIPRIPTLPRSCPCPGQAVVQQSGAIAVAATASPGLGFRNIPPPPLVTAHLQQSGMEQGRDAQGKFLPKQPGQAQPGSTAEKEGLAAVGATKNTQPIPGSKRIPDGKTEDGQYVEVKSGESVSNTGQLREMGKAAVAATGKPLIVITTDPKVKVTKPAKRNTDLDIRPARK